MEGSAVEESRSCPIRKLHRLPSSIYALTSCEFSFTVCARHHGEPFRNEKLASAVVESLLWTRERYRWHLFCYCLMPDHLHFVCRLTAPETKLVNAGARGILEEGALEHLSRFKSYTTTVSWKLGFRGPLWQKSSYDRVVDTQRPFEEIVAYVLNNPVRKGLVEEWSEWPYSGIVDLW
jgi:REP element-mobilizing transposase RayT